jgi:uncharacterized membrane protein YdfJ with MMPL/SSD domain
LKLDDRSHGEEWYSSRDWLFRSCVLLIAGYALLLGSYAWRPLLAAVALDIPAFLYCLGRFLWHIQRNSYNRRMTLRRADIHPVLKIVARYPVAFGFLLAAACLALGLAAIDLGRHLTTTG